MAKPPEAAWREQLPAWPLGCALAVLGLMFMVSVLGMGGVLFASAGLPLWLERGGPIILGLSVPLTMLAGGLLARRRNPYAARALLWGFAFTLLVATALTLLFNWIDRLSGLS